MKKLLKYMKGYGKECVLGPLFKLLEASFELLIPLVVAKIVDTGIHNQDTGYIIKMCLVMISLRSWWSALRNRRSKTDCNRRDAP